MATGVARHRDGCECNGVACTLHCVSGLATDETAKRRAIVRLGIDTLISSILVIGSKRIEILHGTKNGVHAFGYNSAK